ncbi:MAG: glycoside hydrolase family 26 protein [Chitinophagaceae bacterium]|nr:glycoside hydrolase family 26 protein [Chitinophagaceae bacterium]
MKRLLNVLIMLAPFAGYAQPFPPVNPNASPEAKSILSYLYSINGKYILSGQHNYNQSMNRYSDSAKAITGKYPAVWGTDFIWNGMQDNGQAIVDESIKKWKEGYLITLMWHEGRPTDNPPYGWKESVQAKLTDAQWQELTTPGTPLYNRWLAQIDKVAGYLAQLRDAHVPVLWRPYHEMNGVWFWWGDKKGEQGLAKLWKNMYDRYVNHFKLNNLLWVWGANGLRDLPEDEAFDYKYYYPGAGYVDVLGADVYRFDYEQSDYNALLDVAKGKLIALTEIGELLTETVLKAQPKWSWFLTWSDFIWTANKPQRVKDIYGRQGTLSHEDVKTPEVK